MVKILSVHSFRRGTGKSNLTANIAALLAAQGKRVCVIDTDLPSPGIHLMFRLGEQDIHRTLNDFLEERCDILQAAYDVTPAGFPPSGSITLIPSSTEIDDITKVLRESYDTERMNEGLNRIIESMDLDLMILDTHAGITEETLLMIAISDTLLVILRPDQQDYQGTAVLIDVARRLDVPDIQMLINKVPYSLNVRKLKEEVAEAYQCPVVGVLPLSEELVSLASAGIFVLQYPESPMTYKLKNVAAALLS
jgi:MinD-like ATPase involved in chromosome partitioning or flagellar assembly